MKCLWPCLALLSLACLLGPSAYGVEPKFVEVKTLALSRIFVTKKDWNVSAYEPKEDDTGYIAAKVCFWADPAQKETACEPIQSGYAYQSVSELAVVPVRESKSAVWGVLLAAHYTIPEGGSGSSTAVLIWTYDPSGDKFERKTFSIVSGIGEYRVLGAGPLAGYFVIAEGIWVGDEGHFGLHHFDIRVYKYGRLADESVDGYHFVLQYITSKRYESEEVRAIMPELDNIQRFLRVIYPKGYLIR